MAIPQWIALQLHCKLELADRLIPFLSELVKDLSVQEREDVGTAFRELLMNAIEHGAGKDPNKTVRVEYVRAAKFMIYKISDPGEGFSLSICLTPRSRMTPRLHPNTLRCGKG